MMVTLLFLLLAVQARAQDESIASSILSGNDTAVTTRRPYTTRYTTTKSDEEEDTTTKAPHDIYIDSGKIACPGVCLESRLTQYCEAYLTSQNLCVSGRMCCVTLNEYDKRTPDLVVPNEKKKHSKKRPTTALTTTPAPKQKPGRKCRGDCVTGIFVSFCDHVDEDAYCPSEGTCCLTETKTAETTTRRPPTSPRPNTPPPLPRCPGYCMMKIMAAFCERPAVLISNTHCNHSGSICCDDRRIHQLYNYN